MKILYAIQGTGNGHLSRAREFVPLFQKVGDVDLLVSGTSADVDIGFDVRFQRPGISYTFGKNGGIDYIRTIGNLRPVHFLNDLMSFPIDQYDLVISDYEPISAWSAYKAGMPCVGLSHQSAFLSPNSPRPEKRSITTEFLFRNYAPCSHPVGFHYLPYDDFIFPPVIRQQVRSLKPTQGKHITVYLPAYAEEVLIPHFQRFKAFNWHIFSKHTRTNRAFDNVVVRPVCNASYLESLESSWGLISGGGFEAPAEALYLGKRLLVIPMFDQYEQLCNAEALKQQGVLTANRVDARFPATLETWFGESALPPVAYPDMTQEIVDYVVNAAGFAPKPAKSASMLLKDALPEVA